MDIVIIAGNVRIAARGAPSERILAKMGSLAAYGRAVALMAEFLPLGHTPAIETARRRTLHKFANALPELRRAAELAPGNGRYAYVYAIALNSTGAQPQAMELLETSHKRHPADRDTLLALVSIARESGDFATALLHARELVAFYPLDMQLRLLILDIEKRQVH